MKVFCQKIQHNIIEVRFVSGFNFPCVFNAFHPCSRIRGEVLVLVLVQVLDQVLTQRKLINKILKVIYYHLS